MKKIRLVMVVPALVLKAVGAVFNGVGWLFSELADLCFRAAGFDGFWNC